MCTPASLRLVVPLLMASLFACDARAREARPVAPGAIAYVKGFKRSKRRRDTTTELIPR